MNTIALIGIDLGKHSFHVSMYIARISRGKPFYVENSSEPN
ncbi:hypothetical protein SAMN05421579_1381 [Xenorhabdus japonica]|uniref:Transposase n=1 Tax=Xenorhabdus japonica TaxID=53341 RepID=A0A1I5DC29_9GAMM|nr:hypothetical protein SAMN05421579_1381 [Xenorhabdus japonica]